VNFVHWHEIKRYLTISWYHCVWFKVR